MLMSIGFWVSLFRIIVPNPLSIPIVNPPSLDFVEIVKVSLTEPVFLTSSTKSVSPPGSAL